MVTTAADPDQMLRTSANYDEWQWNTAGQKDVMSDYDMELKNREDSVRPWVTKVKDSYKELWDNSGKEDGVTAGYDPRVLDMEADLGSHINPDAAAMVKQEYVDDRVRGGDEDGGGTRRSLPGGKLSPTSTRSSTPSASSLRPRSSTRVYSRN